MAPDRKPAPRTRVAWLVAGVRRIGTVVLRGFLLDLAPRGAVYVREASGKVHAVAVSDVTRC